jgi:transforming growth factor-beta-induced protein
MKKTYVAAIALMAFLPSMQAGPDKDIVQTAQAAGSFKTLTAALAAGDLVETLKGKGPFTVFAPTDEAFAKLPKGTVTSLLKPENKNKLVAILTYHVVQGKVKAKKARKLTEAKAVSGVTLKITTNGKGLQINKANVIKADVKTKNGVIHVIDSVLLPPSKTSQIGGMAKGIITAAISKGVPLFNNGHHEECAKTYLSAGEALVKMEGELSSVSRMHVKVAIHAATKEQCNTSKAWIMRRALNQVYASANH